MIKKSFSAFTPQLPWTITYMLQASEYDVPAYIDWLQRAKEFQGVAKRRTLKLTLKAKILLMIVTLLFYGSMVGGLIVISTAYFERSTILVIIGVALLLMAPIVTMVGILIPLLFGYVLVQRPKERQLRRAARRRLADHPGIKVAIAGSYGKTTFRELLRTVLSTGKDVAAVPENHNTPSGISRFVMTLDGNEEVLVFEFGEYFPGDIRDLCELVQPDIGMITGINESHLSKFKTIERTAATIFELDDFMEGKPVYKNIDNVLVAEKTAADDPYAFSRRGAAGWRAGDVDVTLNGTTFTARKGKRQLMLHSGLLGEHIVGPLLACVAIAEDLGLSDEQIERGVSATIPFAHRMQPRRLHGATVVDDTYNGNIDGVRAGVKLLKSLPASRRIYVTPGLVEQGARKAEIHREVGRLLASGIDVVVLMHNSATPYIHAGLQEAGFRGELQIVNDPLLFYNNLEHFVATGDLVLMQNDWTDNYA